jgi:hypothetical protein
VSFWAEWVTAERARWTTLFDETSGADGKLSRLFESDDAPRYGGLFAVSELYEIDGDEFANRIDLYIDRPHDPGRLQIADELLVASEFMRARELLNRRREPLDNREHLGLLYLDG